ITALAVVGSATSTSLMSRGSSITTDLPTPSGTKREVASPATSWITGTDGSAAGAMPAAANPSAMIAATSSVVRISVAFAIKVPLVSSRLLRRRRADAKPDHVDGAAALVGIVFGADVRIVEVDDAAQRERQHAHELGTGERLGLIWRELERCRLADDDALAVLFLDRLLDRWHAHVGENDLAGVGGGAGLLGILVDARQDDVDVIVRQDEAAGAGFRRDVGRDRALALGQDRGHVARALRPDQPGLTDRLAGRERLARDRSGELIDGLRALIPADEEGADRGRRPGLPAQIGCLHGVAEADVVAGNQNVGGLDI